MLSVGVASLPLIGLGQYGYHPKHGCNLLRCSISLFGTKVPSYSIYFMGYVVACIITLITAILIFKQVFCYNFSNLNFSLNCSQKSNLKEHSIFAVFIILYNCCNTIFTFIEFFESTPTYSTVVGIIIILIFLISFVYIRLYILMSPKCKEMLSFLFRDINSVVTNSKSIIMSNYDSGNNVSKCRVNSLELNSEM